MRAAGAVANRLILNNLFHESLSSGGGDDARSSSGSGSAD